MHSFVTIVVPFSAFRTPAVEQLLDQIGNPAGPGIKDPLDRAKFVHFLSITVVEGDTHTRPIWSSSSPPTVDFRRSSSASRQRSASRCAIYLTPPW